ncbi:conserved hypothetical protein [Agrobacterium deltaense RV3]|nr:conserved hypothetical protein [Agrobacterium deltaense RV3]
MLVTGIQPTRVCAAKDSSQPKDLGWLDSCDKHRNEGESGKACSSSHPRLRCSLSGLRLQPG